MADEQAPGEAIPLIRSAPSWLILRLSRAFWGLRVTGLENVPRTGPVIVAGNHVSNLDGPLLAAAAGPARNLRFLGKAELFRVPVLGWYLRRLGMIPLERSRGDVGALRAALELLRSGGCLGFFPEGTRSKTGLPLPPKGGVGFLAGQSGALVVPARLVNTARFPWGRPLEVRFGEGLRFAGDRRRREDCLAFARRVMDRVFAL